MEAMDERRVWQRVRGTEEPDRVQRLRDCLRAQGELWAAYRQLSRRGGKCRQLFDQKENQIACLRGLLRVLTGQSAALPRAGEGKVELLRCFSGEQRFLRELTDLSRDPELGPVFETLRERQKCQCRLLLEILGTM